MIFYIYLLQSSLFSEIRNVSIENNSRIFKNPFLFLKCIQLETVRKITFIQESENSWSYEKQI